MFFPNEIQISKSGLLTFLFVRSLSPSTVRWTIFQAKLNGNSCGQGKAKKSKFLTLVAWVRTNCY